MIEVDNPTHGRLIAGASSSPYTPGLDHCVANVRASDYRLLGGVIFQQYLQRSIQIHVASFERHWLTKQLCWAMFDYPFNQLGVEQVIGMIPTTNRRSLNLALGLGFRMVTRIPEVVPGGDIVVLSMRRGYCKWLALKPSCVARSPKPERVAA